MGVTHRESLESSINKDPTVVEIWYLVVPIVQVPSASKVTIVTSPISSRGGGRVAPGANGWAKRWGSVDCGERWLDQGLGQL
ncbi:hypothetical protein GUJ93_ZPchr0004g39400 [Zizania palustris]|uniref:Uncharacterized protein n=1 Tax=Zizania palustris TaxID=103762 RepID=A0A8J5S5P4_ZIZPA|nr:hypothetical protein GUJ93_ZPchr0004g39400 [Zizania palustris]